MNRKRGQGARLDAHQNTLERCRSVETAGRWPWKSATAKECVTTHLPNRSALKMDGARASGPCPAVLTSTKASKTQSKEKNYARGRRARVGGRADPRRRSGASRAGAIGGADLGGSSKHSSEALEGRSGAGLHTNVDRLWPSRARGQGEGIETRRGRQRVRGRPKGNRASIPEPRRGDLPGRACALVSLDASRVGGRTLRGSARRQRIRPRRRRTGTPGRAIFSW